MKYTIVQARVMLSQPELALFESSRGDDLRGCTVKQLERKIVRTRALRDKYRDLYQRQTVATRQGPTAARAHRGGENERTREKAELFRQALARFEDRLGGLSARRAVLVRDTPKAAKPRHNAPGAPTKKTNPPQAQRRRRSVGEAKPSGRADLAMRGATSVAPRGKQRLKQSARELGAQAVEQRAADSTKTAASKRLAARKPPADKPAAKSPSAKKASARPGTSVSLTDVVNSALAQKQARLAGRQPDPAFLPSARARAQPKMLKASGGAVAQGPSPTDGEAVAQRLNPLKADPGNQKIHASARGRHKVFQAKRDSRSGR